MKILNDTTIVLCCGGNKCPVIEDLKDGTVKITDDFGSSIVVKSDEAGLIPDALKVFTAKGIKESNQSTEQLILG